MFNLIKLVSEKFKAELQIKDNDDGDFNSFLNQSVNQLL